MKTATALLLLAMVVLDGASVAHASQLQRATDTPLMLPLEGETVTNPNWREKPSNEDLQREYPPLAQLLRLPGSATMTCQVETDGRVDDCHVASEVPPGLGFGAAAVRASAFFVMIPAKLDGKPVRSPVTIPLQFRLGDWAQELAQEDSLPAPSPASLELARRIAGLEGTAAHLRKAWESSFDQQLTTMVVQGGAETGQTAVDALRQSLVETIAEEVERHARYLAAGMTEVALRATVAYLESGAGTEWIVAEGKASQAVPQDFVVRLSKAARAHLCPEVSCGDSATAQARSGPP